MPNFNDVINNFGCGNDLAIQRSISGVPQGQAVIVAWFYVKRELSDPDINALIIKRVTASETIDGQILDNGGGDTVATVLFHLTEAETTLLSQPVFFEIRVETADSFQYTSNRGVIRGQTSVINSAS